MEAVRVRAALRSGLVGALPGKGSGWPRKWPKSENGRRRLARRAVAAFPDTRLENLESRVRGVVRRRQENRRARRARRLNRGRKT